MRYLYHATDYSNLYKIMIEGIKPGFEGIVYCTENPEEALRFLAIRGIKRILLLKLKVYKKDEYKIVETYDHSRTYFDFKCFGYTGCVETNMISEYFEYNI